MTLGAFIPARSGSKRIPGKNIRAFRGHPLIAYAIQGALDSALFQDVCVSSDSEEIGRVAMYYGAQWIARPLEFAADCSPDQEWITHALGVAPCERYAILRPTSPFRSADTIARALKEWDYSSHMKAVQPVSEHPGKMWLVQGNDMRPLWPGDGHLCQTNTLLKLHVQNASLEFRVNAPMPTYQPFFTWGYEGFDLNTAEDWMLAETLMERGLVRLPKIEREPYPSMVYAEAGE
jgi:N-acylneuraminate cytidylyltransferase